MEDQQLTVGELEDKLTGKQAAFCREYILDLNATQAAIRAGYSEKTARSIGAENLTKPDIIALVEALRSNLSYATGVTKEGLILELKKIVYDATTDEDGAKVVKLSDRINAAKELNKMFGHYAPTKTENTHEVSGNFGTVTLDDYA